ncbi:phenylalanine 4-monooxygenase [Kangiella sediminilitoris]|uniref:Phenylalanine-4-hydroxylase n=1 Tax=Kangiella sediminilitoris TaxID=1144748 RepID=A0A1B3BAL3_9GAMM|nr:phenylalanine 4-monooxygenase [Kangiella sediminilitoris]AOE49842.1 Phenylalanine-4-hydroxylase [Kangiella sediminilitoris]
MTEYIAKQTDSKGFIDYTFEEDKTWEFLYKRQMPAIEDRACKEYIRGLEILGLSEKYVPQLPDVNRELRKATGWEVAAVPALIPFGEFFELLANKKFPAATFIRKKEEIDYLQEPDIFHEIYGHCPLLTDPVFAEFVHNYGKLGLNASKQERLYLARIFWFTVEFGLIQQSQGLRIYGAGILSSIGETIYSLESDKPERKPFDLMTALRTPYRIDIYQTVYFVIKQFEDIYAAMDSSIINKIHEAIELGDFKPTFPPKKNSKEKNNHDC